MQRFTLAFILALPLSAANLIQNPGFEDPVIAASTFYTFNTPNAVPNWTWDGPGAGLLHTTNYTEGGGTWLFPAASGQNAVDMTGPSWTGNNVIWQDVPTVAGQRYVLSFALGNQDDNLGPYTQPASIEVLINGVSLFAPSLSHSGNNSVIWAVESAYFTASSATTRVAFRNNTSPNDNYAGLDDVSVEAVDAAVPEPSMMLPAALALAFGARRKLCRYLVG